jgi:hypothetical protein
MEPFNTQPHMEKVLEHVHGLEGWLMPMFAQAPHIPEKGRRFITDIAPWCALIFGVLGAIGMLASGFVITVATVFSAGFALMFFVGNLLPMVCSVIAIVLTLMAYPGLRTLSKTGWNYIFYSTVVSSIGGILGVLAGDVGMLLGTALGALVGFWLLFEVRAYYK